MVKHEEKHCPRCQILFECKVGCILLCQCSTIELNGEERDYIAQTYQDCLCVMCMKDLKADYQDLLKQEKLKNIMGVFYTSPQPDTN